MSDEESHDDNEIIDNKTGKYEGLRFVSFSKCVSQIGGDNAKLSRRLMLTDSTEETFFTEALTKWNDQDHGAHYTSFVDEIPVYELKTYAQLLHHRDTLAKALLKHMADEHSKSIPAFCELLSALARDLRDEFGEYMWPAFDVLTNILDFGDRDKDSVEAAFYCLSLLIKILWKRLSKNIKKTFTRFIPLFGSSREYVRRFAAEGFAFLMRKLNDLRDITGSIVNQAFKASDKYLKDGCAALFFNVYKGWNGGFHSAADQQIAELINGVLNIEVVEEREYGFEILERMTEMTALYVKKAKGDPKLGKNVTLELVEKVVLQTLHTTKSMDRATYLLRLIPLMFIEKHGKTMFVSEKQLFSLFEHVIAAEFFRPNSHFIQVLSKSLITIFSSNIWNLPIRELFAKIINIKRHEDIATEELLLDLFFEVRNIAAFDLYVFPALGEFAKNVIGTNDEATKRLISLYALVCSERRPLTEVVGRTRSTFFDVARHTVVKNYILNELTQLSTLPEGLAADMVATWPWLFSTGEKIEGADHVLSWLEELLNKEEGVHRSQLTYIAASSLFQTKKEMISKLERKKFEDLLRSSNCSESAILLYRLFVLSAGEQKDMTSLLSVAKLFAPAFFCANSSRRKAALDVLSSFKVELEGSGQVDDNGRALPEPEGIFSILLAAENSNLTDSRGRLLHFRKLLYGPHERHLPKGHGEELEHIILRVGLSQFFVQFTLLWPGMHELLTSFARGMDIDKFWKIMEEVLEEVQQGCRQLSAENDEGAKSHPLLPTTDLENRFDYLSARIQILKFIAVIADLAERRTRVLSPLLLNIYEKDFLQKAAETNALAGEDEEQQKQEIERSLSNKELCKALCAFLDIFAKFSDAKSVYLEPKIRAMYDNLLTFGNDGILKSTINCLFSYKNKALTPYRENFDGLLDEKTFRDQLVIFKILEDEGDAVVHHDHRATVMPILLRLLYGKLRIKTKKGTAVSRRIAIFRYLGGCRPNELQLFIDILFEPVIGIVGFGEEMFTKMEEVCRNKENLSRVKLECISDALSSVSELVRRIARVIVEEQQTQLLRVLLTTAVVIRSVINSTDEPEYRRNKAKDLRVTLSETLSEFFSSFPARTFCASEIHQLLGVMVTCYLEKAVSRSGEDLAIAPQSSLKLLATFARMPSYTPLLSVQITTDVLQKEISLLNVLISPLLWNGLSSIMLNLIRGALMSLLSLADEATVTDIKEFKHLDVAIQGTNYGTALVVKHISPILSFLANALEDDMKGKHIAHENMEIINRLSDFVSDGEIGRRMALTILGQLEKSIPKEEMAQKMIYTLGRLIKLVEKPQDFLPRIARLFSVVDGRVCRQALVGVLGGLQENKNLEKVLKDNLLLAADLDSWDVKRVDEPDHDKRHAAYSTLFDMWATENVFDMSFISLVVHTHMHTLNNTTDIALRSSSAANLRSLCEHIGRAPYTAETRLFFVDKHVIPLILKGFRNSNEAVREECVRCLVTLIATFRDHQQLSTFIQLGNKDEDLDFFTNLIHIQLHRRQRAIGKLATQIKEGKVVIPFDVLNRYLVPFIYHYLIALTSKISALSDECLRLLNAILELAPWSKYIQVLDHWLARLDRENDGERPIVRVLVSVIDAFHFEVADVTDVLQEDGTNENAIAIRNKITQHLLPRLHKCINGKAAALGVHKKARTSSTKYYNEDDDIIRAPVALATVKLLQKMPESILKQHLHGVVLKLCWLMISRSSNVRETARKVAMQVCDCLGPRYLPYIIKEMKLIMTKGFQLHVMIFTVHSLIYHMQSRLSIGGLDPCLEEILDLSVQDQFEDAADEKEVGSIKAEVAEAKGNKTPDTLFLLGKFTSSNALGTVLEKFKVVLDTKTSSKAVTRVGNLLAKFANGIKENSDLTPATQLVLVYQVLTNNIEKMENVNKKNTTEESRSFRPTSCLILPDAPKRIGALVKTSLKSRVHVFVEFALQLLSYLITGRRFDASSEEDIAKLDPFVPIVNRCLTLKYDKVISLSVKCITGLLHMEMPALQGQLKSLSERLFVLLSDYAVLGNAGNKHSILQLNHLLFKAFTKVISIGSASLLTKKHLALLLSYVETDVIDSQKQATAFSLIKAIIKKKIEHERLPEVMQTLAELSITNQQGHIRTQCRDTLCEYIGNHPQAGDPKKHLEFFCAQLEYEYEDGRLSAAETLHQLFNSLLPKVLDENCFFCLLKLCPRLVNDEVPKCRKYVAMTVRKLLEGVSATATENVASAGCDWLESEKEPSRAVGAELLVQLSFVETSKFCSRLPRIFAAVADRLASDDVLEENSEATWISLFDGLVLILRNSGDGVIDSASASPHLLKILERLPPLIKCQDSSAVCLSASSFVGQCLSMWKTALPEDAPAAAEMVSWMTWQLKDRQLFEQLAEQASKNIVFLSQWLDEEEFAALIKRLASICRFEIANQPKVALKRITCFKLAAALALRDQEGAQFGVVCETFLPLFIREINRKSAANTDELCNLATEISEVIKTRIGEAEFGRRMAACQKEMANKSEDRKRKIKEMAVTAPEDLALLKTRKNAKKSATRKRRLDELKPHRVAKRKHLERSRLAKDDDE